MSRAISDPAYVARDSIKQFAQYDVKLPQPIADTFDNLERVTALAPAAIDPVELPTAIADGATPAQIVTLLADEAARPRYQQAVVQAVDIAGRRVLSEIRRAADDLHEQLRKQADELIGKIEATAALGDVPISALLRAGRTKDAGLVADLDLNIETLQRLWQIRSLNVWHGAIFTVNATDCSSFRDPRVQCIRDGLLNGIRAGAQLWYPTPSEAIEAAERINAAMARKHQAAVSAWP
jgi:hypothetical protein